MAKKKKKIKDQMGELVGVAVSVDPIVATERKKKMSGGKTMKPAKTRYTYNKGSKVNPNEGIEALRKEAPEVVERMGYQEGKEVSDMLSIEAANEMIAPIYVELLQIEESLKDKQGLTNIPQTTQRKKELEQRIESIKARTNMREKKGLGGLLSRLVKTKSKPRTTTPVTTNEIGKIEKFLMNKKYPEAVSFSKKELDQIKKESGGDEEYLDFLSEFNAVKEGDIAYIIKAKKEGSSSKDIKNFLENLERNPKAEGGEMDSQMTALMMPEESKEEMDMLPDDQMEDQHLDFIINESLDNEEEMYLMEQLQADERLSMIFDKIMDTATEFSGSGPVEGLGTEVSDSIPARLSDGEFVMTAKATDEIGADSLERMMKDAEEASDNRQRVAMGGEIEKKVDRFGKPIDEDLTAEEIKRSMLSVNPRLR